MLSVCLPCGPHSESNLRQLASLEISAGKHTRSPAAGEIVMECDLAL